MSGLTSAEYRRTFTVLVLLNTILLAQTRMGLAFFWAQLDYVQSDFDQHSQVFFPAWCLSNHFFPQPVALCGLIVTQVQDLELHLIEPNAR